MAYVLPQQVEGITLYDTSEKIVNELKSRGIFDTFRKECLADVDTRPAYQNLRARVEATVVGFLNKQTWTPDLNRNQLRERLRKHLTESRFLEIGVDRIVDQVVDRNIYTSYMPQIRTLVNQTLDVPEDKPEPADDDVEMEDVTAPTSDGNTFGNWANQFHAPVPEAPPPPPEPPADRGHSSMSISSASTDSHPATTATAATAVAAADESNSTSETTGKPEPPDTAEPAAGSEGYDSPDIRAQISPLSDDGKQTWGSFLDKTDGLDFSGLMSNVGRMDPAIDEMIKSELGSEANEANKQDSPNNNSNVSAEDGQPAASRKKDGSSHQQSGGGRDHSGERRHRYNSGGRGDDRHNRHQYRSRGHGSSGGSRATRAGDESDQGTGRYSPEAERRRRQRDRDRDRERSRREPRPARSDAERHRRDSGRHRDRDDHEQQRERGRHHQRRDRDDDGGTGHRSGSGRAGAGYGHTFGGGSRAREGDRDRGTGSRYHGYGNGRTADAGDGSPHGVSEVTVGTEHQVEGKAATGDAGDTVADKASKASSLHKKSSEKHSSQERFSKNHTSSDKRHSSSGRSGSSGRKSSSVKNKSSHSSKELSSSKSKRSEVKSSSVASDTKPLHGDKTSSKSSTSRKTESGSSSKSDKQPERSKESEKNPEAGSDRTSVVPSTSGPDPKLLSCRVVLSPSDVCRSSKPAPSKSNTQVSVSPPEPKPAPVAQPTPAPADTANDRMVQLMEKYAPHLKDRWHNASKPERSRYTGEPSRPMSPSQCATVRLVRELEADLDQLSVSSVETADLSDFDDCLEMELELTEPERRVLHRLGWRHVDGRPLVADSPPPRRLSDAADLIGICDGDADADSVDSGFNRSDASSLSAGSAEAARLKAATYAEPAAPVSRPLSPSAAPAKRRRKRVDYVALNSGLDGESGSALAATPGRRQKRAGGVPSGDGDWRPGAKRARGGPSPRADAKRTSPSAVADKLERDCSSEKENIGGLTHLRDPGAAGDSVRIRPNLVI